jgi:hypothetical protein
MHTVAEDWQTDKPALVSLERDARGRLVARLSDRDEPLVDVRVARCFPWSRRNEYISVRDADGKEVLLLSDLDEAPPEARAMIEQELGERVFVPRIQRIVRFTDEFDVVSITAETDRGEVTFQFKDKHAVRTLSPTRAIFRDVDGNLYEVPDLTALDRASQRHISRYF